MVGARRGIAVGVGAGGNPYVGDGAGVVTGVAVGVTPGVGDAAGCPEDAVRLTFTKSPTTQKVVWGAGNWFQPWLALVILKDITAPAAPPSFIAGVPGSSAGISMTYS